MKGHHLFQCKFEAAFGRQELHSWKQGIDSSRHVTHVRSYCVYGKFQGPKHAPPFWLCAISNTSMLTNCPQVDLTAAIEKDMQTIENTATTSEPTTLKAAFDYLQWTPLYEIEKPFQVFIDIPKHCPDQREDNLAFSTGPEELVFDVCGKEKDFTLDKNGFTYIKHSSIISEPSQFFDPKTIREIYLPECIRVLERELSRVGRVHIYSWRVS